MLFRLWSCCNQSKQYNIGGCVGSGRTGWETAVYYLLCLRTSKDITGKIWTDLNFFTNWTDGLKVNKNVGHETSFQWKWSLREKSNEHIKQGVNSFCRQQRSAAHHNNSIKLTPWRTECDSYRTKSPGTIVIFTAFPSWPITSKGLRKGELTVR